MPKKNQNSRSNEIAAALNLSGHKDLDNFSGMLNKLEEKELSQLNSLLMEVSSVSERRKKLFSFVSAILLMRPINVEKEKIAVKLKEELVIEERKFLAELKDEN